MTGMLTAPMSARPWRRSLTALLASFALLFQGLLVQTHVDFSTSSNATALAQAHETEVSARGEHPHEQAPAACWVCQAVAFASGVVLGAGAWQPLVRRPQPQTLTAERWQAVAVRPSHAWRSRAPPSLS